MGISVENVKQRNKMFIFLPFEIKPVWFAYCLYFNYVNLLIRFKVNKVYSYLKCIKAEIKM